MDLNSIALLSFALGVVLILAAVIGKEIKIAAIELPAVSEKFPRLILAIIGMALIYFSIFDPFQLNPTETEPTAVASAPTNAPATSTEQSANTPTSVPVTTAPEPTVVASTATSAPVSTPVENVASEFNGYYLLQTRLLEAENKCLEGNNIGGDMGGAAFMHDCTIPATGQIWKLVPAGDGYYLLQTQGSETENKCLEGNNVGGGMAGGAAFMNDCTNPATGQMWKLVPLGDGYYLLQTRLLEAENKCLEGNNAGGDMGGAAFMSACTNATGQMWKLVPSP